MIQLGIVKNMAFVKQQLRLALKVFKRTFMTTPTLYSAHHALRLETLRCTFVSGTSIF